MNREIDMNNVQMDYLKKTLSIYKESVIGSHEGNRVNKTSNYSSNQSFRYVERDIVHEEDEDHENFKDRGSQSYENEINITTFSKKTSTKYNTTYEQDCSKSSASAGGEYIDYRMNESMLQKMTPDTTEEDTGINFGTQSIREGRERQTTSND
mmetsp:Transcript_19281/g.18980  ORF Transcript_19281/g.18980 Transcript_19281/m.18980 type:complete len:153 (+) Transcript_19281:1194-1652(+)